MTLAPPHDVTDLPAAGSTPTAASVTAVLVLRGPVSALPQTLDSLARQTRSPERLIVVDLGLDGSAVETVRAHRGVAEAIPTVRFVTVPSSASLADAVRTALAEAADPLVAQGSLPNGRSTVEGAPIDVDGSLASGPLEHVWVLTMDTAAAPMTLARLLDAVRRSPSVGIAGPKLVEWDRPGRLRSVGLQLTRSGRVIPSPAPGEPDQGQYDRRTDVLAVPSAGMLAERQLLEDLGWHERALGDFGAEIDLGWRAQQAGRRVVVVPRATARTGALPVADDVTAPGTVGRSDREAGGEAPSSTNDAGRGRGLDGSSPADALIPTVPPADSATRLRRQARRVALARCSWWSLPFLAAWIAASSVVGGIALLLAKRPRAAWAEFSDLGALLSPGRVLGARWRSRGTLRVRRRDLSGLFVRPATALRYTGDLIHDQVALEVHDEALDPGAAGPAVATSIESGPVSDEAEDLNVLGSTWTSRAARNPGLLAVLATTAVTALASRHLGGGALDRFRYGVTGGELYGVRADAVTTWHTWLDGWHGAGLGHSGEQSPALVVLAGLSWLVAHLPVVGAPASPLGSAVALLVGLAMPLATLTAYLGARVVTRSPWPRALAALAWGTTSVLTSAVAVGRLGAVVAAILLPLVAAGCALLPRRGGSATGTAATVLAAAVLGAFVPALLAPVLAAAVATVLLARGSARLRGLALLLGPLVLLGPWCATLFEQPQLLLAGPGLAVWGQAQALPWQIALLHPGGAGSYPVLLSAPLVLAGLLGLARSGSRGRGAWVLGLLALTGLAFALTAPRLHLGTVPGGEPNAGAPVTAWAGTGLMLTALALLAAALLGSEGLPVARERGGWQAVARWPVAGAVIVAVLAGAGWTAWQGVGDRLGAWTDPRPAVAVDQAESTLANRMLLLEPDESGLSYELLGREPGAVARTLPSSAAGPAAVDLHEAVSALFESGGAPGELRPAQRLSDLAVGFVGLRTDPSDPRIRGLDSTAGLSRLGEHDGVLFWRVLAGGGTTGDDALAPSRARLVMGKKEQAVPVDGPHASIDTKLVVPQGASLVLAEPADWTHHARVTIDGRVVAPRGDTAAYDLPAGPATLRVQVLPTDALWRNAQGLALLLVVFLAVPFGNRSSRRRRP